MRYGNPPKVLGEIPLNPVEHMLYLYLPLKMPGGFFWYPNLPKQCDFMFDLIDAAETNAKLFGGFENTDHYLYLTAKTMWVGPGCPGNRPGWHADGFGSNGDLNYIWYDMNPTEFAVQNFKDVSSDDTQCLKDLEYQVDPDCVVVYPNRTLLRLDESVVHRVNTNPREGLRTFIKISISRHKYNLKGNSHNYLMDYKWDMFDRVEVRNTDNKDFVRSSHG
jgi:hypothetical protein